MKKVKKPLSRKHLQLVLDRCMVQLKEVNAIAERQRKELRKREETAAIMRQVVAQLKLLTVGLMQQWKGGVQSDDQKTVTQSNTASTPDARNKHSAHTPDSARHRIDPVS